MLPYQTSNFKKIIIEEHERDLKLFNEMAKEIEKMKV